MDCYSYGPSFKKKVKNSMMKAEHPWFFCCLVFLYHEPRVCLVFLYHVHWSRCFLVSSTWLSFLVLLWSRVKWKCITEMKMYSLAFVQIIACHESVFTSLYSFFSCSSFLSHVFPKRCRACFWSLASSFCHGFFLWNYVFLNHCLKCYFLQCFI